MSGTIQDITVKTVENVSISRNQSVMFKMFLHCGPFFGNDCRPAFFKKLKVKPMQMAMKKDKFGSLAQSDNPSNIEP